MKNKLPLSKILLRFLGTVGSGSIEFLSMFQGIQRGGWAYVQGGSAYVNELKRLRNKNVAHQALRNLQASKYVTARKIGDRLMITLTAKGQRALLVEKLASARLHQRGTYTVVIFDIPESQRISRRQLRLLLRQGRFRRLQQSVWISDKDAYAVLVDFVKDMKLQSWVNVFQVTRLLSLPRL